MQNQRKFLVPSIPFGDVPRVKKFAKYFGKAEVDLIGIKQRVNPYQNSRIMSFRAVMDSARMKAHAMHLRFFDLSFEDPKVRDRCLANCNNAYDIFRPKIAVIHPGKGDVSALVSNIAFLAERIPPGLTLVLENMTSPDAPINSPETVRRFVELIKDLPPNVGICIDASHCPYWINSTITGHEYTSLVLEYMEAASPRLKHLHFSDLGFEGDMPLKHLPFGKGIIDWERLSSHLQKTGYEGKATIEIRFTEDVISDIIASARYYYGTEPEERFLSLGTGNKTMPELDMIKKEEMLERVAKLPSIGPVPETLSRLLNMPKEGLLEQTEDFLYLVSPSEDYKEGHADPYDVITEESRDRMDWGRYVFGIRYHGTKVSAVLVDKERKISVEEIILRAQGDAEVHWEDFEKAIKEAISYAKDETINERIAVDHINLNSFGDPTIIDKLDSRSWD